MDIRIINEVIEDLENKETTQENVQELASLYIVREYIVPKETCSESTSELLDILPHYRKYCNTKRQYQLGETESDSVIESLKSLSNEIYEFLTTLYSSTNMLKERKELEAVIAKVQAKFTEK